MITYLGSGVGPRFGGELLGWSDYLSGLRSRTQIWRRTIIGCSDYLDSGVGPRFGGELLGWSDYLGSGVGSRFGGELIGCSDSLGPLIL